MNVTNRSVVRFGPFELEPATGELRRDGARIRLQPQPARVLELLVARPGELVTREEIQTRVWNEETFVDFEHGVNFCIREIRAALGDNAREPRYVETLPRRGYRFVAAVETAVAPRQPDAAEEVDPQLAAGAPASDRLAVEPASSRWRGALILVGVLVLAVGVGAWRAGGEDRPSPEAQVPAAREAYLAGRYLWNKGTTDALTKSLAQFERALVLDPGYAPAYSGLADSYRLLAMNGGLPTREASEKAKSAALKALELDPGLAEARVALGSVLFRYEWDWAGAEKEFRQAIAGSPAYALGHHDYAWFLVAMGRFDEAVSEIEIARDLDPLSPVANADVGWVYLRARRYDDAIAQIGRTLEIEPGLSQAYACLELAYMYKGMYTEARDAARHHIQELGADEKTLAEIDSLPVVEGLQRSWRWKLERRVATARERPMAAYPFASMYAALGERDQAFEWLERAFVDRDPMLVSLNVDPAFDGLRADLRFADLLRRVGLGA